MQHSVNNGHEEQTMDLSMVITAKTFFEALCFFCFGLLLISFTLDNIETALDAGRVPCVNINSCATLNILIQVIDATT